MAEERFPRSRRIAKELEDVAAYEESARCGISVEMENDLYTDFIGKIAGPPDTPYEGGRFILKIKLPENYPFRPPEIKFITKIWHPNICPDTGTICLDTLTERWTPALTLRTILLSLQQLLTSAEPDNPLNVSVMKKDSEMFMQTAKYWTQVYAGAPGSNSDFENKVQTLKDNGIDEERARNLLALYNWDVKKATVAASDHSQHPSP